MVQAQVHAHTLIQMQVQLGQQLQQPHKEEKMLKHICSLEHVVEEKLLQLICPHDCPVPHVRQALRVWMDYLDQVEAAAIAAVQSEPSAPVEEQKAE